MSEQQRSRRRFLADLLFLGGAAGAAAFLVQSRPDSPTPQVTQTPTVCEKPTTTNPKEVPPPPGAPPPPPPPTEAGNVVQPPPEAPKTLGDVELVPPPPQPQVRGRVKIAHPPPESTGGASQ